MSVVDVHDSCFLLRCSAIYENARFCCCCCCKEHKLKGNFCDTCIKPNCTVLILCVYGCDQTLCSIISIIRRWRIQKKRAILLNCIFKIITFLERVLLLPISLSFCCFSSSSVFFSDCFCLLHLWKNDETKQYLQR